VSQEQVQDITINRRHPAIGSEVLGIDLRHSPSPELFARLQELWMDHPVLVFPGQQITDAEQIAFARQFGALEIHPSLAHRSSSHPEIYRVANVDEANNILPPEGSAWQYLNLTWLWHTDSSFREVPSMGSILHGIEIPAEGGDTLFANMCAAWDDLPTPEQKRLLGLQIRHSHDHIISLSKGLSARADKGNYTDLPPVTHPLVRRHPVTGRVSLFLSPHTMEGVVGMPDAEGRALLDELITHATQDTFVYRHQWAQDDVIMWDNRCTMHAVMPYDSASTRRIMHRTTIVGNAAPERA
jgi:alpha-ketoglutarate-dependent taurine dioxygenase